MESAIICLVAFSYIAFKRTINSVLNKTPSLEDKRKQCLWENILFFSKKM